MVNAVQLNAGLNRALNTGMAMMNWWTDQDRLDLARQDMKHRHAIENRRLDLAERAFDIQQTDQEMLRTAMALDQAQTEALRAGLDFHSYAQSNPAVLGSMAATIAPASITQGLAGASLAGAEYDPETGLVTFQVRTQDGSVVDSGLAMPYEELHQRATNRLYGYGMSNVAALRDSLASDDPRRAQIAELEAQAAAAGVTAPSTKEEFYRGIAAEIEQLISGGELPAAQAPAPAPAAAPQQAAPTRLNSGASGEWGGATGDWDAPRSAGGITRDLSRAAGGFTREVASRTGQGVAAPFQMMVDVASSAYRNVGVPFVEGLLGTAATGDPEAEAPPATPSTPGAITAEDFLKSDQPLPEGTRTVVGPDGSRLRVHRSLEAIVRDLERPSGDAKANATRATVALMSLKQANNGALPGGAVQLAANIASTGDPLGLELMKLKVQEMQAVAAQRGNDLKEAKQLIDYQNRIDDTRERWIERGARVQLRGREGDKDYDKQLETLKAAAHMITTRFSNEFQLVGLDPHELSLHPEDWGIIGDVSVKMAADQAAVERHNNDKWWFTKPKYRRELMSYFVKDLSGSAQGQRVLAQIAKAAAEQEVGRGPQSRDRAIELLREWEAQANDD